MDPGAGASGPVVVGVDGSKASLNALAHGIREAEWRGVALHALNVLDVTPAVLHLEDDQTITTTELAESDREEIWRRARPLLERSSAPFVIVERDGDPGDVLCTYGREIEASLIVVGPRGRGRLAEALLGSTADKVIEHSDRDVLVVRS
jgi:nucleotide-binding universal stress UspA family protein